MAILARTQLVYGSIPHGCKAIAAGWTLLYQRSPTEPLLSRWVLELQIPKAMKQGCCSLSLNSVGNLLQFSSMVSHEAGIYL